MRHRIDGLAGYLTPLQAGRRLNLSPDRVRDLADTGQLRCERTPLGRLIDAADVERLARERAAPAAPTPAA